MPACHYHLTEHHILFVAWYKSVVSNVAQAAFGMIYTAVLQCLVLRLGSTCCICWLHCACLHSYTQGRLCCREVLSAMATQAMQRLSQFNSQNMSNTLWAFASLNHHPGPMLLKVLQRELVHKLPHFTSQGIENVLWAFATLGHHPGQPLPQLGVICIWCYRHLSWHSAGPCNDTTRHTLG